VIRHRPHGRGHPYLVEPDQRFPAFPSAGFELRATTDSGVRALRVELDRDGSSEVVDAVLRGEAVAEEVADWGGTAPRRSDGHLSDTVTAAAEEGEVAWSFAHAPLQVEERLRYRFVSAEEMTEWFEVVGSSWQSGGGALQVESNAYLRERLVQSSVRWLTDGERTYAARFAISLEAGERVVGFGERFNGLDQRGKLVDTVVFDQYKGQGARSYLPMPFAIVVGGGFGFHLDTGHRARFDIALTDPNLIQVEVDLTPGEEEPQLSLQLLDGQPTDVLADFLDRVGRPAQAPPDWIYRLWMSSNEWNSQARVMAEVDRSEAEGIPVGAIAIEAWSDEETFVAFGGAEYDAHKDGSPHSLSDFVFPSGSPWPDPKRMVEELHERGVKVLLWQIPLAKASPAAGSQAFHDEKTMIERGYSVAAADGTPYRNPGGWFEDALLLDFTNPEAKEWWVAKRRYLIDEIGIDGFKTDGGEHAWSPEIRYADGTRGGATNNRYPVLYAKAYHELMRDRGRATLTFGRAGYTGSQAFPAHWAGDEDSTWEALRASISAGLSVSACGVFFWSFDLGGFSGPLPTPELYLRSAAVAALCPIMQYHSEFNFHRSPSRDRTPWNIAEQTGDATVIATFRRFVRLRERLVPYLAHQGRLSVEQSKPLMRPLFFETDDARQWEFPYEYFLGNDLLVAPVVEEGVTSQRVFLPEGEWVDAWQGSALVGGCVMECGSPTGQIPVFVAADRADAIVPLFHNLDVGHPHAVSPRLAEVS
jgi:alpha-glucosidase (family GH31 glycosyl hydrolase)